MSVNINLDSKTNHHAQDYYSLPANGDFTSDDMEYLCRQTTCFKFGEQCSLLTYSQVYQLHSELQSRAQRISHQLRDRMNPDPHWKIKATSALSMIEHKASIVRQRLSLMRDNHMSVLMNDIGGVGYIKSKRLVMIKCLLHIIDHYIGTAKVSPEERSVVDACRAVGDVDVVPKFGSYSYDPVNHIVSASDGTKISEILLDGFMSDEFGYLHSNSDVMQNLLSRVEPLMGYIIDNHQVHDRDHDESKCIQCLNSKKLAEELNDEIVDLLTEIK